MAWRSPSAMKTACSSMAPHAATVRRAMTSQPISKRSNHCRCVCPKTVRRPLRCAGKCSCPGRSLTSSTRSARKPASSCLPIPATPPRARSNSWIQKSRPGASLISSSMDSLMPRTWRCSRRRTCMPCWIMRDCAKPISSGVPTLRKACSRRSVSWMKGADHCPMKPMVR